MPRWLYDQIYWRSIVSARTFRPLDADQPGPEPRLKAKKRWITLLLAFRLGEIRTQRDDNWNLNEVMGTAALAVLSFQTEPSVSDMFEPYEFPTHMIESSALQSTCDVNHSNHPHKGSGMTPEPWLVAAHGYTQTSRRVQSCLFFRLLF